MQIGTLTFPVLPWSVSLNEHKRKLLQCGTPLLFWKWTSENGHFKKCVSQQSSSLVMQSNLTPEFLVKFVHIMPPVLASSTLQFTSSLQAEVLKIFLRIKCMYLYGQIRVNECIFLLLQIVGKLVGYLGTVKYIASDHHYRQSGERNVQASGNLHSWVNPAAPAALAVLLGLGRRWWVMPGDRERVKC